MKPVAYVGSYPAVQLLAGQFPSIDTAYLRCRLVGLGLFVPKSFPVHGQ
jgi:hypothetical protein